uniref:ENT domain-containing protein n=1 Tax=Macrostomum lignano TaxID=282301 RepID=A0A1I8JI30_9PLAT
FQTDSAESAALRQLEQLRRQSRNLLAELRPRSTAGPSSADRLLSDVGNLRPAAPVPEAEAAERAKRLHRRALPKAGSRSELDRTRANLALRSADGLGYDWMMSSLENCGAAGGVLGNDIGVDRYDVLRQEHSELLQRVLQFRKTYRNECISDSYRHEHLDEQALRRLKDLLPGSAPGDEDSDPATGPQARPSSPPAGPPVYAYTVNERLFPVPLNLDTVFRQPPSKDSPAVVQVSIPYGRVKAPSKVLKPPSSARTSLTASTSGQGSAAADTMSLHSHCAPGYRLRPPDPTARPAEPAALQLTSGGGRRAWRRPQTYREAIELVRGPQPAGMGGLAPQPGLAANQIASADSRGGGGSGRPATDRAVREGIQARMRHLPTAVKRPDDLTDVPVLS